MPRTASGSEHIAAARKLLKTARSADELRLAQAVLLPLVLGLSIEQTAKAIGRSAGATSTMRNRFLAAASGQLPAPRANPQALDKASVGSGRHQQMIQEVLALAAQAAPMTVAQIKEAIEAKLGRTLALSSLYRMLGRQGWKRSAPGRWTRL